MRTYFAALPDANWRVLVALATAYSLHATRPPAHKFTDNLLGETWYRIEMQSAHVGFMHNNAYRDVPGRWHFAFTTHFLLGENTPQTVDNHLVFDASARAHLQHASYTNKCIHKCHPHVGRINVQEK